ncbi:putative PurR-regulated permease PerM [Roseiarcus fermentans]|uniref:Putative PurR-regulated permease PerM n=1 Tax=Roseiarcus fermentans TaxID=1473586 RepID=A0A366FBD0_9HYPH|nr:AI-2E family transporter [Roseiarcus fermentans]RBP11984.1 putative PurR-regulated permease PerM [Roseiarcus fermentans]
MTSDSVSRASLAIVAAVALAAAAYFADTVFAPLTLALFIIALVWPFQRWLQSRIPALLALAVTMTLTVLAMLVFASLAAWGFGRVGRSLIADSARYQAIYDAVVDWLDGHGVSVAGLWAEHFNWSWLLRGAQQITGRVNTTLGFWIITLVYVILGLMEVEDADRKLRAYLSPDTARVVAGAAADTARKFRKYMQVRTLMSVATGLLVWAFAAATGLQFALEWGVIAFVLNYIPFIGPFIATLFPTLLAMAQFATWQAALGVFVCLNVIQFVIGSYVEPRVSGAVLAISPSVVLLVLFFWTFLWGLYGAFIGVPIAIAVLTVCEHAPSTRWIADLLGGPLPGGVREKAPARR